MTDNATTINALAQAIRRVDGQHTLGAAALAEALLPEIRQLLAAETRPGERHALVTVETIQRLTVKASEALDAGNLDRVHALHTAILNETSIRMVTAVKTPDLSDLISAEAARMTRARLIEVEDEVAAARAEAILAAEAKLAAAARSVTGGIRNNRR
jgi:hypothetical protein